MIPLAVREGKAMNIYKYNYVIVFPYSVIFFSFFLHPGIVLCNSDSNFKVNTINMFTYLNTTNAINKPVCL